MRVSLTTGLVPALALSFVVAGCSKPLDLDLRSIGRGFDTSDAVRNLPARPTPDSRGVISYPTYSVAVARKGDTLRSLAARIGVEPGALARHNGLSLDAPLRAGETVSLPGKPRGATTSQSVRSQPLAPASAASAATPEPVRHKVRSGETAYTVARLYNVSVQALARWNGLGPDLAVREGQFLLIPEAGATPPSATTQVSAPGRGSSTPTPPSATTPLPAAPPASGGTRSAAPAPAPKPQLEVSQQAASSGGRLMRPVSGSVIREYAKGRNDGIDISAASGAAVKAADSGTVAAVTENTNGAKIVVIKHSGGLLTVYVNVSGLKVSKGSSVRRGQTIASVAQGSPSFLHFEVRKGLESVDPNDYL